MKKWTTLPKIIPASIRESAKNFTAVSDCTLWKINCLLNYKQNPDNFRNRSPKQRKLGKKWALSKINSHLQ